MLELSFLDSYFVETWAKLGSYGSLPVNDDRASKRILGEGVEMEVPQHEKQYEQRKLSSKQLLFAAQWMSQTPSYEGLT